MDKSKLIEKLDESVRSFKEQLDKHEGSTLSAMATGAKAGFESARAGFEILRESIMGNDKAQKALDTLKEQLGKLEDAIREGDRKVSAKAVAMMEKAVRELKEKQEDSGEEKKDNDNTRNNAEQ